MPVWIVSIDFKKAFDRVEHSASFKTLEEQSFQSLYENQYSRVGDKHFRIECNVRQSDILSLLLFDIVLGNTMDVQVEM